MRDIAKRTGKSKTFVQSSLNKLGIELRPKEPTSVITAWRNGGKQRIRPFYGYCYFQGKIVPDQREYENLMLIYKLWKTKTNPNRISDILNEKKVPARNSLKWNRNSVVLILNRFNEGIITLKGGHLELR